MSAPRLRGCPTCSTPIEQASTSLGLRDYRWVSKHLPGKVNPSDIDAVLERNDHFLLMEYKSPGAPVHMGQRIMLKRLVRRGFDVWVVWGDQADDDSPVQVGVMTERGDFDEVHDMTAAELGRAVAAWFENAEEDA